MPSFLSSVPQVTPEGLGLESGAGVDVGWHAHADAAPGFAHGDLGARRSRWPAPWPYPSPRRGRLSLTSRWPWPRRPWMVLAGQNQLHSLADAHEAAAAAPKPGVMPRPTSAGRTGPFRWPVGCRRPCSALIAAAQGEAVYRRNHGLDRFSSLRNHAAAVHAELLPSIEEKPSSRRDVGSRHSERPAPVRIIT